RKYVGDPVPAIENVALFFPQPQSIIMTVLEFQSDLITSNTSVEESEVKRATVICLSQEEIRGRPCARNRERGSVLPPTSINYHDSVGISIRPYNN
ncbi:hypothetical protein J6590_106643, partial [Homalodisca vitripennis]